jgi:hypothetical protein
MLRQSLGGEGPVTEVDGVWSVLTVDVRLSAFDPKQTFRGVG